MAQTMHILVPVFVSLHQPDRNTGTVGYLRRLSDSQVDEYTNQGGV